MVKFPNQSNFKLLEFVWWKDVEAPPGEILHLLFLKSPETSMKKRHTANGSKAP